MRKVLLLASPLLVLAGCAKLPATAGAPVLASRSVAAMARTEKLPLHMVVTCFNVSRTDHEETQCMKLMAGNEPQCVKLTAPFPYYVAMYDSVCINEEQEPVNKGVFQELLTALQTADDSKLPGEQQVEFRQMLQALKFNAGTGVARPAK